MKYIMIALVLSMLLVLSNSQSYASWLVYHKPEFKGRVIDAETKGPIEGAVVVVTYQKTTHYIILSDTERSVLQTKETLTNKDGEFYFPSYTALIQPFSTGDTTEIIIYKPGYGSFPGYHVTPRGIIGENIEKFFSKRIGSTGELEVWDKDEKGIHFKKSKISFGRVELPILKTKEERLKDLPAPILNVDYKKQRLFIQLLNEDRKALGLYQYSID